jgi:type I restriction enzyme M protein
MGTDVKGKIYEGLLEKNAEDTRAAQGSTSRKRAPDQGHGRMLRPEPPKDHRRSGLRHGGILPGPYDYLVDHYGLDKADKEFLKYKTFYGNEIVGSRAQACPHELFPTTSATSIQRPSSPPPIPSWPTRACAFDYVLTNPLSGRRAA